MEPDDNADKAARQDLRSKIAFFNNQNRSNESQSQGEKTKSANKYIAKKSETQGGNKYRAKESPPVECTDRNRPTSNKNERFWSLPIFKGPTCFICTGDNGKLEIVDDTLKQIRQIEAPLVVVGIAGLYRTGKSYLMNCLAGQPSGFALGNTIESKTKGIWAWCRQHPRQEDTVLFLLDTEGLGDVGKGDIGHDNKIFTITTLLCNVLVYNMMSAFNQDAVEKLTFISEMSKNIRFKNKQFVSDGTQDQTSMVMPAFVLCLRDFILDLEKDGKEMTADEYLVDCLQLKKGEGSEIERFNKPRESIVKYFKELKCFTFDRPGDKKVMKRLESVPVEALSESFREDTATFLAYMYGCESKKMLCSKSVRGDMFATLATIYVRDIRDGAVPDVDNAIDVCANIENERIADAVIGYFNQELENVKLPILKADEFEQTFKLLQQQALDIFRSESVFNADKFEIRVIQELEKTWNTTKETNDKLVLEHCSEELKSLHKRYVGNRMDRDKYKVAGGYEDYKKDVQDMKREYLSKMQGMEEYIVYRVLNMFLEEESKMENEILASDKKMNEEERKREMERVQKENEDARLKQSQMFEERMEQEKQRAEEHRKQLEKEREEKKKEDEEKMKEYNQQWKSQIEISEKQLEMMKTDNEKLRNEIKEIIDSHVTDMKFEQLKKEKEKAEKKLEEKNNRGIISRIFNW